MYDWLPDASHANAQVVTANRRLSRVLAREFGLQQVASGQAAWLTPEIMSWRDWLVELIENAAGQESLPTRISAQQSSVIWERCLRKELGDDPVNIGGLVRLSLEAWSRIHEWQLSLDECRRFAHYQDQRLFAAAARRYAAVLAREHWIDDAAMADLVRRLVEEQRLACPARITFAGFDRNTPQASALLDALAAAGIGIDHVRSTAASNVEELLCFENPDSELRAAGAWARRRLENERGQRIGIVVAGLEQETERKRRLVLEGFAPGWQYGPQACAESLNVSYGRRLAEFPAIGIALLALRWVHEDLPARDVSLLLRSPLIGSTSLDGRARLELRLRQLPDRGWSPLMAIRALPVPEHVVDATDWLHRVGLIAEFRRSHPRRASPTAWAELIDEFLGSLDWPGDEPQTSDDYQLVNRWRNLLNEFARLEIVSTSMTFPEAARKLSALASETVFQPESDSAALDLLGPLEAAGMEFDALWLCGLTADAWPPAGRPSPMISRRLQREYGMPDADPRDTADYASRTLGRLVSCAPQLKCSYAIADDDTEQAPTTLLGDVDVVEGGNTTAWHACALLDRRELTPGIADPAPPLQPGETVAGGASTVQKQLTNPFAAFVSGRLGVRYLPAIVTGLAANVRGNLIHDALAALYGECPSQSEIAAWDGAALRQRIAAACRQAFARLRRHADHTLQSLLELEQQRVERLLAGVVALDKGRPGFTIDSVEGELDATLHGVPLRLRYDRIDRIDAGGAAVLDYKTGQAKRFVDREGMPQDLQLVVYAATLAEDPTGLAIVNVDSRNISIEGAGTAFDDGADWHRRLGGWKAVVRTAIEHIARGDVRVHNTHNIRDARAMSLLSRFPELRRDG